MKPLQFYQKKTEGDWNSCVACYSTTKLTYDLENRQKINPFSKRSLNSPTVKKKIAEALTEYYSILFNPEYQSYFRPLTDLTLLFPTNEVISINPETNFILLPLPLPTYSKWTYKGLGLANCPYLTLTTDTNEWIRDMDLTIDSNIGMIHAPKYSSAWNVKENRGKYNHTDASFKLSTAINPVEREARIWTYKYRDVPNKIAKTIPSYPTYSLSQYMPDYNKSFNYIERQYTFLEIPSQVHVSKSISISNKIFYHLKEYSRTFEINQLSTSFANHFNFNQVPREAIVNYFLKHVPLLNEYSYPQIKSGIKRLKDIIRYGKKKDSYTDKSPSISTLPPTHDDESQQAKFNQSVRYGKYKGADGERHEFVDIDQRDYKYKSTDKLKSLYSNDN